MFATSLALSGCDAGTYKIGVTADVENQDAEQTADDDSGNSGGAADETDQDDDQSSDDTDSNDSNDDEPDNESDSSEQEDDSSEQDDTSDDADETDDSGSEDNQDSADDADEGGQDEDNASEDSDSEQSGDTDSDNNCSATAWDSNATYVGGDQVVHNGVLYEAKWWTQTEPPAEEWQQIAEGCSVGEEDTNQDNDENNDDDSNNEDSVIVENHGDKMVSAFFVEWGVYGRDYHVPEVPGEKLTHLYYGFLPICGPNDSLRDANPQGHSVLVSECAGKPDYSVTIHDKYAALEKSYPGDSWDDPIKGNFNQLKKLKQKYPHLKIMISVGGWTLSDPFYYLANDPQKRSVFVNSTIDFLRQYDFFDGLDIDWEFPGGAGANPALGGAEDFQGYADLMCDLRAALDNYEAETGREYELTSAIGAGPSKIDAANYAEAHHCIDHILAMTYDYYGAWSNTVGHLTALNNYPENSVSGAYATYAVDKLLDLGVPAHKIAVGVTMYGRGWSGVQVPADGSILNGIGNGPVQGSWEPGSLDYKDIVDNYLGGSDGTGINGYTYYYDEVAEGAYLYNDTNGNFITYDNPRSVNAKAAYVMQKNLGGLFSWEIDADNGDILDAMNEGLGNPLVTSVPE